MTLLEALINIRDNGPTLPTVGICENLGYLTNTRPPRGEPPVRTVERLARRWPKVSHSTAFPVPHRTLSPAEAYTRSSHTTQWNRRTVYGRNRWELLDFLIEELSK